MDIDALKIDDWSGGITDHYVNGPLNRSQRLNNFLVNRNRKPVERPGSDIFDESYYQIPAGASRVGRIHYFDSILFQQSARAIYFVSTGWNTLVGPVSSNPVFGAGTTSAQVAIAEWNNHLLLTTDAWSSPRKIYKDGSAAWQVRNIGLPDLASSPSTILNSVDATDCSYVYAFLYKFTYTVGTVTYIDRGPLTLTSAVDASGSTPQPGKPCAITAIPILANSTTECWDTANIKVEIYRTSNGGVELKLVGEVTNGTTVYSDVTPDASLGAAIYTAGDRVENDPPPSAKYVIVADGVAWYLNVKEGSEEKGFRARQALKDDPDACPGSYFMDIEGDITGGGVIDIYPMVFSKTKTYRFEGFVDTQGRGFTRKRLLSRTVGCVSHNSIVAVLGGLFFAGIDGFYFTDGQKVVKVSNHLNESYKSCTSTEAMQKRIHGTLDPVDGRVYWTMTSDSSVNDCDHIWVLDPYQGGGISPEMCFTTWSSEDDMAPTSLTFIGGDLVRADNRGYCMKHDDDLFTDPVVNIAAAPSTWATKSVVYDYISVAFSFGTEIQKKFTPKITVVAKNETNLSLLIQSINDDSGIPVDLKEVRFRNNIVWGDSDTVWGDPSIVWNYAGTILAERMFPKGTLRCIYKQVRMTNSDTAIINSDSYGNVTTSAAGNTAIFDDLSQEWPLDLAGYELFLDEDDYTQAFVIASQSGDTLTLTDPTNLLPADASYGWIIKGKRKGERLSLEGYAINWEMFGEATKGFDAGETGENA